MSADLSPHPVCRVVCVASLQGVEHRVVRGHPQALQCGPVTVELGGLRASCTPSLPVTSKQVHRWRHVCACGPQGGKISEVPCEECAIGWRANKFFIAIFASWVKVRQSSLSSSSSSSSLSLYLTSSNKEDEGEANKAWVRGLMEDLKHFRAATNYINLALPDERKHQASEFYGQHLQRLRELKRKWDPDNFFRCRACLT